MKFGDVRFNEKKQRYQIYDSKNWRNAVKQSCLYCDETFYALPYLVRQGWGNFCCIDHRNKWLRQRSVARVPKWCVICGTRFTVYRANYNKFSTCDNPQCRQSYRKQLGLRNKNDYRIDGRYARKGESYGRLQDSV